MTETNRPGPASPDGFAQRKLLGLLSGGWLAQACYATVKLGIADLLIAGPHDVEELARACRADPGALHRVLRALAAHGVFRQTGPRSFAHSPVSELLRSDAPGSAHLVAIMHGEEVLRSFAEIMHTMRTGRPAFEQVYGEPFYQYLAGNPQAAYTFNESMGAQRIPAALSTCDLTGVNTVVDVGGGNAGLLIEVLRRQPQARGVLLELPDAIARARVRLAEAGVGKRVELVEGSFFDTVPAGGDIYVLARVLHNWTDEHAVQILRRVRASTGRHARLLVLEEFLPEEPPRGSAAAAASLVDLLMLVTLEGRDRTETEYRHLLIQAGFEVTAGRRAPGQDTVGVLEAVPA